ncbi:MAG: quinohemoprotein ethanol dehydrogenase [Bradyrhizobium sp.]|jgi:outer membrane protein assembly factor BamB|nr:quinohemoprotein ethanol dehydrogenase [Bradyrhizobium sp.]
MATNSGWWMYHGDPAHTGFVGTGSAINAAALSGGKFGILHTLNVGGSILSVPAVTGGFIYVGLANSRAVIGELGGTLLKIELASGLIVGKFTWSIPENDRDAHGFCGMGCTPSVVGDSNTGKVYFVGFNAKLYCLNAGDLSLVWTTDLRNRDLAHNQPIQTFDPTADPTVTPPAAGWSAPLVINGRVYLGIGEGENPNINSFVFCLDAATGNVVWVFCTNQFACGLINKPNQLPERVISDISAPPGFTVYYGTPLTLGCSVWGCIAYDAKLDRLFCPTGNGQLDGRLPTPGWSNGLLTLDATSGAFKAFYQMPRESNYRDSDIDVDVGASPTLFDLGSRRVVGVGCKNGSFHVLDADTLAPIKWRQLLPKYNDGTRIPTVDPHADEVQANTSVQNPRIANRQSDVDDSENYSGIYSTAAVHPPSRKIFVGIGGNNYHSVAAGIDTPTTPFMRALDYDTLADAWPVDTGNPPRYTKATPPMFTNFSESGLSSPAVVNDVVFMATTYVSLYAFSVADGTVLFEDRLGEQTGGFNGGYGYCMGPAVCGNYVVAGALVFGGDGGVLRIYGITDAAGSV